MIDGPVVNGGTAVIVLDEVLETCAVGADVGGSLQASAPAIFSRWEERTGLTRLSSVSFVVGFFTCAPRP